jgi:general secretion pathway protein L
MPELLLLRLDPAAGAESVAFVPCTAAGAPLAAPRLGSLAEAAAAAAGRQLVVLVPGAEVVQLDAELPALPPARLLAAVPYAVEDSVAADVETLHFAVGRRGDAGRTPVAVIDRATLQSLLEALRVAGLEPDALHADSSLIAGQPGHLVLLLDGATVHACRPGERAVTLPAEPLAAAVDLALHGAAAVADGADPAGALGLLVFVDAAEWPRRAAALEALRPRFAAMQVQQLPTGTLPWLGSQLAAAAPVNLLQGPFAPRRRSTTDWRRWRLAAALAVTALVLHVAGQAWELRQLAARERELDARLVEALAPLQGALPAQSSPREARRAVETLVARARAGGDAGGALLPALAAFAQARAATPAARLESVGYDGAAVELRVRAPDAGSLETLGNALRAGGWQAEVVGGTGSPSGYEGRIRLQAGKTAAGAPS